MTYALTLPVERQAQREENFNRSLSLLFLFLPRFQSEIVCVASTYTIRRDSARVGVTGSIAPANFCDLS